LLRVGVDFHLGAVGNVGVTREQVYQQPGAAALSEFVLIANSNFNGQLMEDDWDNWDIL
jgi:hypothetical protein